MKKTPKPQNTEPKMHRLLQQELTEQNQAFSLKELSCGISPVKTSGSIDLATLCQKSSLYL